MYTRLCFRTRFKSTGITFIYANDKSIRWSGTVVLKQQEFRDLIDVQDTRSIVAYLRTLESHGLVYYVGRTDRVNTYKLNNKFYFK